MSGPRIVRAPHNLHFIAFLFVILPILACRALTPSVPTPTPIPTPETIKKIQITYSTGIETKRFDNGVIVVIDHKGSYGMAFPEQWEVGAFHDDFLPTVDKYSEINPALKTFFQAFNGKDDSLRIFAIDTSPGHLTKDSIAVFHVGMFQEEWRLQASIEELTAEYVNYINSSQQLKVADSFHGTANDIPYSILITAPISETDTSAYGGVVLIKTDKAYLEMLYTTLDKTINIVDEVSPMLKSFTPNAE
jgi:hypothetical protein